MVNNVNKRLLKSSKMESIKMNDVQIVEKILNSLDTDFQIEKNI